VCGDEVGAHSCTQGFHRQPDTQMCLAYSGWSQEDHVTGVTLCVNMRWDTSRNVVQCIR
jgi:hypothetical protein